VGERTPDYLAGAYLFKEQIAGTLSCNLTVPDGISPQHRTVSKSFYRCFPEERDEGTVAAFSAITIVDLKT